MRMPDIAVVGGGLLGRCLAWRASRADAHVALYDAGTREGKNSAAWAAAGMITPTVEAVDSDPQIASMGRHGLRLWPQWLAELPLPVFYRDNGSLLLWHHEDAPEAARVQRMLSSRQSQACVKHLKNSQVAEVEPTLGTRFPEALYIPGEAQVDNRALLTAVAIALEEAGAECHWETRIEDDTLPDAAIVVDCRGMGAKSNWPTLRGVRGEIVRLHAPEIDLHHMLRLLHPRYPVYIVPRAEGRLVIGATSIEADDLSPVSVRGALELLTAAYSVLPALAEARILEFNTQVRPTLPDNLPALRFDSGRKVLFVNGLYRHGFLLTPTVVEEVLALLSFPELSTPVGRWPCLRENRSETLMAG
ncbi:MAG: glycine oxidase ThiO, partial [Acidobacteria bacterium Pan2503]|nr:glycine oxidase ThiO [Candidatus Acidoferrum panamensis]